MPILQEKIASRDFLAEIQMELFSAEHIARCRSKFEDLTDDEFVALMRKARAIKADPLAGDIFTKRKPGRNNEPGQISVMATIACMRAYAEGQGDYAGDDLPLLVVEGGLRIDPGEQISCIVMDEHHVDPNSNPQGIVYCTLGIYRFVQGSWRRFSHTVTWADYVPVDDQNRLSRTSPWYNIPFVMLQKVAEVGALRKAYPALGALYIEEEMSRVPFDRASMPQTEYEQEPEGRFAPARGIPAARTQRRTAAQAPQAAVEPDLVQEEAPEVETAGEPPVAAEAPTKQPGGLSNMLLVDWCDGDGAQPLHIRDFYKEVNDWLVQRLKNDELDIVLRWFDANRSAREAFHEADPKHALRIRHHLEDARSRVRLREQQEQPGVRGGRRSGSKVRVTTDRIDGQRAA